ncbi:MAG: hypothetical protein M5U14_13740 [Acidimicrobiia bacterium]|nr:hypothetical protein [Acidimicrobiia bacterium]
MEPVQSGGTPFLANGQSGALYPPRVLLGLTTGPAATHDLFMALHVFLSGVVTFALMKELRVCFAGAFLAGVAWMFSSYNWAWLQLEHAAVMAVALPGGLWLLRRAARRRSLPLGRARGVPLGLLVLGGNLQVTVVVWVVCLTYSIALAADLARR